LQQIFLSIKDYADFLKKLVDHLGLNTLGLYGTATGAQIAIRFALEYPQQVGHLYLDNTAHFTTVQRQEILKDYFPDLHPKADGSHLAKLWEVVTGMFKYFPWFKNEEAHRLNIPPMPLNVLHMVAKDFLIAGSKYKQAYRAAFEHERAEYVQQLQVPTTLFDWEASIIRPYTQALIQQNLPNNVEICLTPAKQFESRQWDLKKYPSLVPDEQGQYLLKAWKYLEEHQPNQTLTTRQAELCNWITSI